MAKILLAEDEVNIASFIERGLKEFGHSVTVCHNVNPEKPDVPLNKNDAFQKVQKRRVQEKR